MPATSQQPDRSFNVVTQMREAAYDAASGTLTLTVIQPGFNTSKSRFYPAAVLKRDHSIFEGAKMFLNHQTDSEARARPEGRVEDWAASLRRTWAEADGRVRGEAVVVDPTFKLKLAELAKHDLLGDMGVSIRARGKGTDNKLVEGVKTTLVESLEKSRSVDFVTFAGAGGRIEAMESEEFDDAPALTEAELREKYPDLISLIESKSKGEAMADKTHEQQLQEVTQERDTLKQRLEESERKEKRATAANKLTDLLAASKLPDAGKERIRDRFKEAESEQGMADAITAEQEYIKTLTGGRGVRGMGANDNRTDVAEVTDMSDAFGFLGLSENERKIAAKGF